MRLGFPFSFANTACRQSSGSFVPSDLSSVVNWYDASNTGSIGETGGAATQWNDLVGSRHFTQGNTSLSPTTNSRTINGLNVLDLDGSEYMLSNTDSTYPDSATVFIVAYVDSVTSAAQSIFSVNEAAAFDYQIDANSSSEFLFRANSGRFSNFDYSATDQKGAVHAFVLGHNLGDGTATSYVDGVETANAVSNYTVAHTTPSQLFAGVNRGLNQPMDGALCEIIICDEFLSDADRNAIGKYLERWGLTWSS